MSDLVTLSHSYRWRPGSISLCTLTGRKEWRAFSNADRGAALAAAIADSGSAYDAIQLGAGVFELSAGITPTYAPHIRGAGKDATYITYAGDAFTLTGLYGCSFQDLTIVGRVVGNGICDSSFINVAFDANGQANGLFIQDNGALAAPAALRLLGCDAFDATGDGVLIQDDTNFGLTVANCRFFTNGRDGLRLALGANAAVPAAQDWTLLANCGPVISANLFASNTGAGMYLDGIHDCTVTGCHAESNGTYGYYIVDPAENKLFGCFSEYNTAGGVYGGLSTAQTNWNSLLISGCLFQFELVDINIVQTATAYQSMCAITGCMFVQNQGGVGSRIIQVDPVQANLDLQITNNILRGIATGNTLFGMRINGAGADASYTTNRNVLIANNQFVGPFGTYPLTINRLYGPKVLNNTFNGNTTKGMSLYYAQPIIEGNDFVGCSAPITLETGGDVTYAKRNFGYVTENAGSAQITDGNTTVTVTHGLARTPLAGDVVVTPASSLGAAAEFWVSDLGATTFVINIDADPDATVTFNWQAAVK